MEDHRYVTKAAYVVLDITMDGRKDILGVWIGVHEIQFASSLKSVLVR